VLDSRFNLAQGFEFYDDRFETVHKINYLSERKGDETARRATAWLEAHHKQPFFLFVHFYDPHDGYEPPEPFASEFKDDPYSGEVAFADRCAGEVIDRLKALGVLDSTLVVVTGDHGEMLGEHGELTHQFFIYQGALRVPLIFRVPGHAAPRRVRQLVGLADLVPTLCGLLGIPIPPTVQGEDFSAWLRGENPPVRKRGLYAESFTPTRYYGASPLFGLVTEQWKYIESTRPELYDLEKDPGEIVNLLETERPRAGALRAELKRLASAQAPKRESAAIDEQSRRRLESLGYLGRNRGEVTFDFGADKEDPKDLIGFYRSDQRLSELIEHGRYDEARALCDTMLRERPGFVDGHIQRAEIAVALRDSAGAIVHYSKALELDPKSERARGGLAKVHLWLAAALKRQGKLDGAGQEYRRALARDPRLAAAHNGLGNLLGSQRRVPEAMGHFREAVGIDPRYAEAHNNLGLALRMTGERDEALQHFEAALRLRADWPAPMSEIAWILATHPEERVRNPGRAIQLAERAADLTARRQPVILDSLAAAYAAAGDFDRAAATAQEATALAASGGAAGLAGEIGKRLALYRQKKPFRDTARRSY
jgi:choline-sulfatase